MNTLTLTPQKIAPCLWFEKDAQAATRFYTTIFPESSIDHVTILHDTPPGDTDVVTFRLWGQPFMAFSPGAYAKINPSVSLIVRFEAVDELNGAWKKLSEGGTALMPLDQYPFSERYGWIQDKYGMSWQLILTDPKVEKRPPIMPSLMFIGKNAGRAEEAIKLYLSVFHHSKMGRAHRYGANLAPDKEGTLMFADFMIENTWLAAMDSAHEHKFAFNEAVSLLVNCVDQKEIDEYWKLSAVPESEVCGWIKDKFGLSWQITAAAMNEMMTKGTPAQVKNLTESFMSMKKFDIKTLEKAYQKK